MSCNEDRHQRNQVETVANSLRHDIEVCHLHNQHCFGSITQGIITKIYQRLLMLLPRFDRRFCITEHLKRVYSFQINFKFSFVRILACFALAKNYSSRMKKLLIVNVNLPN